MHKSNPVVYFEIPVNNMKRAMQFYQAVFDFHFDQEIIDNYEMALFPFQNTQRGITGALAKGDVYKPSKEGCILYFKTNSIDSTLETVIANKGLVLYPKTNNEKYNFAVAEFEDSEGNRIALHQDL